VSYDPDEVGAAQMLEAITETGFRPSLTQSRIELAPAKEISGDLPSLIQAALVEARSTGKRVFIDFYAEWCGACRTMDKTTFADAGVSEALDRSYVFVKVDTDEYPEIGKGFNVVGLPTVVALSGSGGVVYRHTGPLKAEPLLKVLREIDHQE